MFRNWAIFRKKAQYTPQNQEDVQITTLLDFLWRKIVIPKNAVTLSQKITQYQKLNITKKCIQLPEIYLEIETYLTEKDIGNSITKNDLRSQIQDLFPELIKSPEFRIIFLEKKMQEVALSRLLLKKVFKALSDLLGGFNDETLTATQSYIEHPFDIQNQEVEILKHRKYFNQVSNMVFTKTKESLGENAIVNIYLSVYKDLVKTYHHLDTFTATLNAIPQKIIEEKLVDLPSKQQMHKMLQQQLDNLDEMNQRLTKEIVERNKIEDNLNYNEYLNSTVLDTAFDAVVLVNQEGIVLNWNKRAEILTERKKENALNRSLYDLIPKDFGDLLKESFDTFLKTGEAKLINKLFEAKMKRLDGEKIYLELSISPIKTKEGYLFNAFVRDITEKKKADREIREAKITAEKSAKAKSTFLSNMSHEIRTPLNVILGLSNILQKDNDNRSDTDRKNLEGIQFSAENLLALINDILDFSKIEAGKLTLHNSDFNLPELISNIARGFEIKAKEKGLDFVVKIAPSIPKFIIGDQFRLNQILTNLLGNAIKFTKKGSVSIFVTTKEATDDAIHIHFAVKDTGIGIEEDKLKNIFNSFYQIHKPGKHKIEGTGLGLSISKQLIEMQGGKLIATSKLEKGSCFEFQVEYKKSKLTSEQLDCQNLILDSDFQNIKGMKVLVVEDNKMNQFFIKQLFADWLIEVDLAEDGSIALEKLKTQVYDLILMDMHMPVLDGTETTKIIRSSDNPAIRDIPIIACSADVFPESRKAAKDAGINFYITKPVSEKALKEVLLSLKIYDSNPILTNNGFIENSCNYNKNSLNKFLDLSLLETTFGSDRDTILSILHIFLEDTPQDFETLKREITAQNFTEAGSIAHKMKSSFKTLGIKELADKLQQIESNAKNRANLQDIPKLFEDFKLLYPKVTKEVQTELEKPSN